MEQYPVCAWGRVETEVFDYFTLVLSLSHSLLSFLLFQCSSFCLPALRCISLLSLLPMFVCILPFLPLSNTHSPLLTLPIHGCSSPSNPSPSVYPHFGPSVKSKCLFPSQPCLSSLLLAHFVLSVSSLPVTSTRHCKPQDLSLSLSPKGDVVGSPIRILTFYRFPNHSLSLLHLPLLSICSFLACCPTSLSPLYLPLPSWRLECSFN